MKALLVVFVLLAAAVVGFGFYEGWFTYSTHGADHKPGISVGVNENKIQADEKKAEDLGHKAKEDFANPKENAK